MRGAWIAWTNINDCAIWCLFFVSLHLPLSDSFLSKDPSPVVLSSRSRVVSLQLVSIPIDPSCPSRTPFVCRPFRSRFTSRISRRPPNMNPNQSPSVESQPDGPVTVNQMNQMMGQILQQFARQQQDTIQQQVNAAVENAVRHVQLQQHLSSSQSNISSAAAAAAAAAGSASTASPRLSPGSDSSSLRVNPSMSSSVLPPKVKISPPSTFTGARSVNVDAWIFEVNQYLTLCGVSTEEQRVAVASSYFKEAALQWWQGRCRSLNPPTQDWLAFTNAIKERFQPLAASRTARAQIRNLRQVNMSVADYSNKFYNLVQLITDMSDTDQVELFVFGLRNAISREVDMREPKTLLEAMTTAQKVETLLDNRRTYLNPTFEPRILPTSTSTYKSTSTPSGSTSSSAPSAMELGNVNMIENCNYEQSSDPEVIGEQEDEYKRYLEEGENYEPNFDIWDGMDQKNCNEENSEQLQAIQQRNGRAAPFLPQEEFTRCMKERLCLRCKKPGHIARHCPLRPPQQHPSKRNFQ